MKVTAAVANKRLKKLQEDLDFIYQQQAKDKQYIEIPGQEAIVPRYNFGETQALIDDLEERIQRIKHAVNIHNTITVLDGFEYLTVDQALVFMAQLNRKLSVLDKMRSQSAKVLDTSIGYIGGKQQTQYVVANFKPEEADSHYQSTYALLQRLQVALDTSNSTVVFEIPD